MNLESPSATRHLGAQSYVASEFQQRLRLIELCVELLMCQTKVGVVWSEGYQEAMRHLETLPLATNEYNLTKQHMQNALNYCHCREFAAAAIELRMVRGHLQRI
jgi:hypothetical protein